MTSGRRQHTTAAMQEYGATASPDAHRGTRAGLVLLYAPSFESFSPAYLLSEHDLVIGRDESAGISVPEGAVSRQHARIRYQDGGWVLTDLGSRNGTLVDGQFVSEIILENLHEIRVGDAIFKFVSGSAERYGRYRIDGTVTEEGAKAGSEGKSVTGIVGGHQMHSLLRALHRVAKSEIAVVLLGESGTGKELFARELHAASGRRGAFSAVNCAAIPAGLLESELFGHKRGAFSGADRDRSGLVRSADGGTLFLDEIGDMPLEAQSKLLRVLQTKEVVPIGATAPERVDVRVVCATHRNLAALQKEGRFRGDLYARLNEYSLVLPPLRERKEDLYPLVRRFIAESGRPDLGVSFPFMTGIVHYDWPFNVRELEATLKRASALAEGPRLDAEHLTDAIKDAMRTYAVRAPESGGGHGPPASSAIASGSGARPPPDVAIMQTARSGVPTEQELRSLLAQHRGNVAAVGRFFGKERMQVHRWMKRYGIDVEQYR